MSIKKLKTEEIPYEILETVGFTRQMFEDLPEKAQAEIMSGHRSPVVPLTVHNPEGEDIHSRGRFSLVVDADGHPDVMIHPVLPKFGETIPVCVTNPETGEQTIEEINATDRYKPSVIEQLKSGKSVYDYMYAQDGTRFKAFLQLDPETHELLAVSSQQLSRNLGIITDDFKLTQAEVNALGNGELLCITRDDDDDELLTVGIDLTTPTGIRFVKGDETNWMESRKRDWDKYEMGPNGCWMTNDEGDLQYIPDSEFQKYDIWNEVRKQSERKQMQQNHPHRGL